MTNLLRTEPQATLEFMQASAFFRNVADDGHGRGLLEFTDAVIQAVASFGVSELYARGAERCGALDVYASRAVLSSQLSARHNERGLRTLSYARAALKQFRQDLGAYPRETDIADDLKTLEQDLNEVLVDLEVKATDVEKIRKSFQQGFSAIRDKGAAGLPEYLEMHLEGLERIRRQADRGAVENIPVWKVAAIALAVGVWVWALFRCRWWGSCSLKEGLAYAIVIWIAALIARFC